MPILFFFFFNEKNTPILDFRPLAFFSFLQFFFFIFLLFLIFSNYPNKAVVEHPSPPKTTAQSFNLQLRNRGPTGQCFLFYFYFFVE